MKKITVFSGNRAEFGLLFPIIVEISKKYQVDIILSGGHVLSPWNTKGDVIEQLETHEVKCNIKTIELDDQSDAYTRSLGAIYDGTLDYYAENKDVSLAIVLGDRIESFAFSLGSFYSQIPLVHLCGGDVANDPSFDTNVRHSISKLANYHFTVSERGKNTLIQMGEEEHRVLFMGNPSFDYERMGFLPEMNELKQEYGINEEDAVVLFTFHPVCKKSAEENYGEFKACLDAIIDTEVDKIIVTYPNNDPGYEQIVEYLENVSENDRICCKKNLGTFNYLGLMKYFKTIVAGNSSSGLSEPSWFCVPSLNIGERQGDRIRGGNVIDVPADGNAVKNTLQEVLDNYEALYEKNKQMKSVFGNGEAAIKAVNYIDSIIDIERKEQLFKKFIEKRDKEF